MQTTQLKKSPGSRLLKFFRNLVKRNLESWNQRLSNRYLNRISWLSHLVAGAPIIELNRCRIRETGKSIWLRAEADLLWERISVDRQSDQQRPDLTASGGREEVVQLLKHRNPIYAACADFTIEIERQSPVEISRQIVSWALANAAECGW